MPKTASKMEPKPINLFHHKLKYDSFSGMKLSCTLLITIFLLAVLTIATSMLFIDKPVASGIWKFTSTQPFLHNHIKDIPNNLPHLVAIGTATLWLAYYVIFRKNGRNVQTQFIQLAAIAVPAAYLMKLFLQNAFGRTNVRLWLRVGGPVEFRWFSPVENGGFPSGHSMVFAAFFTAVWLYYPRFRPLAIAAVVLLGTSLLLTSYHFTSDIIAGICCGVLITAGIHRFLALSYQTTD